MKNHFKHLILFAALLLAVPGSVYLVKDSQPEPAKATSSAVSDSISEQPPENQEPAGGIQEITIFQHKSNEVKTLPMAEYIQGVVFAEMPPNFETEALKAQAVIAHTYTLRIMANEKKSPTEALEGASISTDPAKHQAYLSPDEAKEKYGDKYEEYEKKVSGCVEAVIGQILTYQDEPIIAAFHAISGGTTETAKNVWGEEIPYLVAIESEGDPLSPAYEDSRTLTADEVKNILHKQDESLTFDENKEAWFSDFSVTESGYVSSATICGKVFTGQEMRTMFGLKSANFSVTVREDQFQFTTKGYGHGVGMSQYGADYMARQGRSYAEILAHYYPDTVLSSLS